MDRRTKTTEEIYGATFSELTAAEAKYEYDQKEYATLGIPYRNVNRPAQNAHDMVTYEMADQMSEVISWNGLSRYEDMTPIEFFYKKITIVSGLLHIESVPVAGTMLPRTPRQVNKKPSVLLRVNITDPILIDKNENVIDGELPMEYVESVMNVLNPMAIIRVLDKQLPELLKRAGNLEGHFTQILGNAVKKWSNKTTPRDIVSLQSFLTVTILHEMTHGLALHIPDEIPTNLSEDEKERLHSFSYERYLEILNQDTNLQGSAVFIKNLVKALLEVQNQEPSPVTQETIVRLLVLEMLCDRFSMYMYENYLKMKIYQGILGTKYGDPFPIEFMNTLEDQRRSGEIRRNYPQFTPETFTRLDTAEQEHMYISTIGEPQLSSAERQFYSSFLAQLKYLDRHNQIMRFEHSHANTSRLVHATFRNLATTTTNL